MLEYVQPGAVTDEQIAELRTVEQVQSQFWHLPQWHLRLELLAGNVQLYRFEQGLVLVEVRQGCVGQGKRLGIVAMVGRGVLVRKGALGAALARLAADLGCDAVETMVFDKRLARAMLGSGARPEAVNMVLEVKK